MHRPDLECTDWTDTSKFCHFKKPLNTQLLMFCIFSLSLSSRLIPSINQSNTSQDDLFYPSLSSLVIPLLSGSHSSGIPTIRIQAATPKNESILFPASREMEAFGKPLLTPEYTSSTDASLLLSSKILKTNMKEALKLEGEQRRKQERMFESFMIFLICSVHSHFLGWYSSLL